MVCLSTNTSFFYMCLSVWESLRWSCQAQMWDWIAHSSWVFLFENGCYVPLFWSLGTSPDCHSFSNMIDRGLTISSASFQDTSMQFIRFHELVHMFLQRSWTWSSPTVCGTSLSQSHLDSVNINVLWAFSILKRSLLYFPVHFNLTDKNKNFLNHLSSG